MRLYFSSLDHPNEQARRLSETIPISIGKARSCIALMLGYCDWEELREVTASKAHLPSRPNAFVSTHVRMARRHSMLSGLERAVGAFVPSFHDGIEELYDTINPMGDLLFSEDFVDSRVDLAFPCQWVLSDEDADCWNIVVNGALSATVGDLHAQHFESTLRAASNQVLSKSAVADSAYGVRTFCFYFDDLKRFPDIKDGMPVAVIPFSIFPLISDDVLFGVDLRIHASAMCSNHATDKDLNAFGSTILAYLGNCSIGSDDDRPISGANDGVDITLSGLVLRHQMQGVIRLLQDELEGLIDAPMMPGFDPLNDPELPIKSVEYLVDEDLPDEPATDAEVVDIQKLLLGFIGEMLQSAPAMLGEYMRLRGFGQYAELADVADVTAREGTIKFLAFVRSMERAKTISTPVSIFFRTIFIDHAFATTISGMARDDQQVFMLSHSENLGDQVIKGMSAAALSLNDEEYASLLAGQMPMLREACFAAVQELSAVSLPGLG